MYAWRNIATKGMAETVKNISRVASGWDAHIRLRLVCQPQILQDRGWATAMLTGIDGSCGSKHPEGTRLENGLRPGYLKGKTTMC